MQFPGDSGSRALAAGPVLHAGGDNLRGALLMSLSMLGFTCNDTVMKFVTQDLPLYQAITLRGLTIMAGIALVAWREGGLKMRVPAPARLALRLRTVGEVVTTVLYLNALTHMAIGDASAIMQALPLVVMLAAVLFFGESLGWRRALAAMVGLIGVLVILRPGAGAFGIWSLVVVAAVLTQALRDLATRKLPGEVASSTIAFHAAGAVTLTALLFSLEQGWQMPSLSQALWLLFSGALLTMGYVTAVAAMRMGEMSFVAPFRYVSLLVAILMGLVVFGDWPDPWTWIGSALVVGAGGYSIWREAKLGQGR